MWQSFTTWAPELAEFGLTWILQSTVILVLGLLAGWIARRSGAAAQTCVYRTTLAGILLCPVAAGLLSSLSLGGLQLSIPSESLRPAFNVVTQRPFRVERTATVDVERFGAPGTSRRSEPTGATKTAPTGSSYGREPFVPWAWASGVAIGCTVWLFGSALLVLRLATGYLTTRRLVSSAVRAEASAQALCNQLAAEMRIDPPAVLRSPFVSGPCLAGLRRPAIMLPEEFDDNLRPAFVHELAHLARHDVFWNLLRGSANAILWAQPLIWILSRRLEATAEEVCDDYVVQFGADRAGYAGLLLDLATRRLPRLAPAGLSMVSLGSTLGSRIGRILDPSRSLSIRISRRGTTAIVVAGLAATMLASLVGVGGGSRRALAQANATKANDKAKPIRGQVVGPDGKPVPGAIVIAARSQLIDRGIGDPGLAPPHFEFVRTGADGDGRFEIASDYHQIIATAPGFGVGYLLRDQPIRLTAGDLPINGRLVDLEGRPIAGVKVRLIQLEILDPAEQRKADARPGPYEFPTSEGLGLPAAPALAEGLKTDADGRFQIAGLGRGSRASLEFSGPTVALKRVKVVTRAMDRVAGAPQDPTVRDVEDPITYGANCTIVLEPSRPIEGFVREAGTNKPIPGAVVTLSQFAGSSLVLDGLIAAETDAQGHYTLDGVPNGDGHKLGVYPPLDRPYFITNGLKVAAGPGLEPVRCDVAIKKAIWITGTVADAKNRQVVPASVNYYPALSNEHAKAYPNFDPNVSSIEIKSRYRVDRAGRYRVVGLPGRGVVTVRADERAYRTGVGARAIQGRLDQKRLPTYDQIWAENFHALKEVDVPEGADETRCDLALDPGGSVTVRVLDPDGKPLTGLIADGRFPAGVDVGDTGIYGTNIMRIAGLEPDETRAVVVTDADRKLGAVFKVTPKHVADSSEIVLTLRPFATVTGRLVDKHGKPASGTVEIRLHSGDPEIFHGTSIATVATDAEGRFRSDEIPTGSGFIVTTTGRPDARAAIGESGEFASFDLAENLNAEPGQKIDLGTFDVSTGKHVDGTGARP